MVYKLKCPPIHVYNGNIYLITIGHFATPTVSYRTNIIKVLTEKIKTYCNLILLV